MTRPLLVLPKRRPALDARPRWCPFDPVEAQARLVGLVIAGRGAYSLAEPFAVRGPGAYALIYRGSHPDFRELECGVIYVGSSTGDIAERMSSHRASIEAHPLIDTDEVDVVAVAAESFVARAAEDLLIGAFEPPWCVSQKGFGSRPQGAGRRDAVPTAWDRTWAVRPGRNGA